jgi:type I restriction enzyme, S subunit
MKSEWEIKLISEIVNFNPSYVIKKGTVVPYVEMAAVPEHNREIAYFNKREFTNGSKFKNGDTLFSRITPCLQNGKTAKVSGLDQGQIANGSTEFIVMSAKDYQNDKDFVYYLSLDKEFRKYAEGRMEGSTGRQRVSWQALAEYTLPIPPKDVRKKIAHILSTLDDKIELNHKMNQTLEEMAQSIFKSWFVDFDPVHAKAGCSSDEELEAAAKELGISKEILDLFPSEFEESELGRIPEGWELKKLGECELEIESGTRPKGGIDKELSSGMPSVGAESIAPIGVFDFSNVKYVTNEFASKAKRGWVQNMDVALYKDGGKPGIFMPRVSLYGNGYPFARFMINEHVFLLRSELLGQYYLFQLISSKGILDQLIARGSAKAAQPGLNQVEVNDSKFVLPSKELLSAFNNTIEPLVAKQLENGKQIQTLQQTRDILLPKLLSGELDVSELELDI